MNENQEQLGEISLLDAMLEIVKESISETPLPDTGMQDKDLSSILSMLTLDVLEAMGKPDTEREFVLCSTLIAQVYLNTLQEIYIDSIKRKF